MIPDFPQTVAERMDQFCKRFEVQPCKLRYTRRATDSVVMTDELLQWHQTNGASLDWICIGSVSPMMVAYRDNEFRKQSVRETIAPLSDTQAEAIYFAARLIRDGKATAEVALGIVERVFDEA